MFVTASPRLEAYKTRECASGKALVVTEYLRRGLRRRSMGIAAIEPNRRNADRQTPTRNEERQQQLQSARDFCVRRFAKQFLVNAAR
jgi:hypothetical protein